MRVSTLSFLLAVVLTASPLIAQQTLTITDDDLVAGQEYTWTNDKVYVLEGAVFLEAPSTLTIQAGTIVKGSPGTGTNASALIITRGAQIFANGTEEQPIIFTALSDNVEDPTDLDQDDRGLWGGLVILGAARVNTAAGEEQLEGWPIEDERGRFGGTNDADNSGTLRYLSVRHSGAPMNTDWDMNGITLAAGGSKTTVDHCEVIASTDDGFEWFGGTVNCTYLIAAFVGDDAFDWDMGFRGKGQFWFGLLSSNEGDMVFECDGGTNPEDASPYAIPVLANITAIGSGADQSNTSNAPLLRFRDNSGGHFYNSIFMDGGGYAIDVEDRTEGQDSRQRLEDGDLFFQNNLWYNFRYGIADRNDGQQFVLDALTSTTSLNQLADPKLAAVSRTEGETLDPRPNAGSPAFNDVATVNDDFFEVVDFRGAFGRGPGSNWFANWTYFWIGTSGLVSSVSESPVMEGSTAIYPNPSLESTTVRFDVAESSPLSVSVVNLTGERIKTITSNTSYPLGTNEITFSVGDLGTGTYLLVVSSVGSSTTVPFSVIR